MSLNKSLLIVLLSGAALAAAGAGAAARKDKGNVELTKAAAAAPFAGLKYRLVGPFRGGRATGVAGTPRDPNVYYFGAAAGGVWKTTDSGTTWKPLWDKFPEASPSIGALAVAPSDANIVYVGTGEANIRGNVVTGNGIYKSSDAGKTWKFIGLRDSQAVGRLIVNPTNPDIVFVAALGHPFGASGERGIYRTADGGKTWQRVLYVDEKTGGIDVQFDPSDSNVLYAGMWQVYRKPWTMESGGPGSGLYRSHDGGTTWEKLTGHGLPEGVLGRIGVAPTSDPKRIFALVEADKGGLYRTDDGGQSWKLINSDNDYKQRAWYYTNVFADPQDANKVFIMNTGAYKSTDGGVKFKKMPTFHGDNHQLWVNPADTSRMINSNDGGADVSVDGGKSWSTEMNQPTAQFYHISIDNQLPYYLYGAQQDNTTVAIASGNVRGPIGLESWHSVGGGESGYIVADPTDPNVVIANAYQGNVTRYDHKTGQLTTISPWARNPMGWAPQDLQHRAQWTEPLVFSPHDPHVLYNANEVIFKTTNGGRSWAVISPDLTRNDKSKQQASGGPLTKDNTSIETYGTVFSLVESPVQKDLIWAGTDDGLVQLTADGGAHWQNVTPHDMPEWGTVDMVEADPHKAGTAYIAVDCHRLDDFRPHAFKTEDFGKTWVSITNGIPADAYVHVVRTDPDRPGLLYAGTENGVFMSLDDGAHWQPLQLNLPRTPVHDLGVHAGDLAVATHGRAFWILDDLGPLRQWSENVSREDVHLFTPRATIRIQYSGRGDMTGGPTGANPPSGVVVNYYLKNGEADRPETADEDDKEAHEDKAEHGEKAAHDYKADSEGKAAHDGKTDHDGKGEVARVKLEFLDANDKVIRTFPVPRKANSEAAGDDDEDGPAVKVAHVTAKAGLNRYVWDMKYEGATLVPKAAMWQGSLDGPVALPGHYKVRITVDGKSQTQPFEILPDPRLAVTPEDLRKQFDLGMAINDKLDSVQNAVLEIRTLHQKVAAARTAAAAAKPANAAQITQAADTLEQKSSAVEEKLVQRRAIAHEDPLNFPIRLNNMLASLGQSVSHGDNAPTQQAYVEYEELQRTTTQYLAEWNRIKADDLASFNALIKQDKMPAVVVAAR
ncbi:MAG: hypothetical protein JWM63_957 [Gammaproteobacteria bacterium]|jgi:photosystem II stability/assembly factor-like uncharacterized protein|nr:hypothetical protein [Gammaproteobacteria bacterium]